MEAYPTKDIERFAEHAAHCCAADQTEPCGQSTASEEKRGRHVFRGARIVEVLPESPADDAGFVPGCYVTQVDGQPVRDIIDWRWLSADDSMRVGYIDLDGDAGEVDLERDEGEDWGFSFEGVVFDGVRQCRNACLFCFMRQLPQGMRPSLTLRDDDFRLSFLSGTFVTLTNVTPEDEARILDQCISPLRVSLHAVDADVRRRLVGKHAAHGLAVLDRLLEQGVQAHAQIVLLPGENDGEVLKRTLDWAYAREGILNIGIVPLGYTKHQRAFERSFNEPASAQAVLDTIAPFQRRALAERDTSWVFAADEFYRNAFGEDLLEKLPSAGHYGDFGMFEDGIGIIRSFVDDWHLSCEEGIVRRCAAVLRECGLRVRFVVGEAMQPFFGQLVEESPLCGVFEPLVVSNDFFGGNVDVTGLLCGCDMVAAVSSCMSGVAAGSGLLDDAQSLKQSCSHESATGAFGSCGTRLVNAAEQASAACGDEEAKLGDVVGVVGSRSCESKVLFCIPRVVFNDDGLTLDGMTLEDMEKRAGVPLAVVSCNPSEFLPEIEALARDEARQG